MSQRSNVFGGTCAGWYLSLSALGRWFSPASAETLKRCTKRKITNRDWNLCWGFMESKSALMCFNKLFCLKRCRWCCFSAPPWQDVCAHTGKYSRITVHHCSVMLFMISLHWIKPSFIVVSLRTYKPAAGLTEPFYYNYNKTSVASHSRRHTKLKLYSIIFYNMGPILTLASKWLISCLR